MVQIAVATLLGMVSALAARLVVGGGLVFGLALSVASDRGAAAALQERRLVDSERGRIAIGWLIVEDLAMVLALVLLPALAGCSGGRAANRCRPMLADGPVLITLGKVAAFVAFMLVVGRRVIPWMLHYVAHTGSRELFRLAVLAIALGVALGAAYVFGVSFALGAFFAGMILSESELSQRAAKETLPLRDAFAVLFFVSVGMLFDPAILVREPLPVLATVFIIVFGKSARPSASSGLRPSHLTALTISASLAQIGEFSFILAARRLARLLPTAARPDSGRRHHFDPAQSAAVPGPRRQPRLRDRRPRLYRRRRAAAQADGRHRRPDRRGRDRQGHAGPGAEEEGGGGDASLDNPWVRPRPSTSSG
jgi:CPA2 family monovalent cation:H+ antiporter-2